MNYAPLIQMAYVCDEDPDRMAPTSQGLHCARCQHEVIDFSEMDLADIHRIQKEQGIRCGIFAPHQVQGAMEDAQTRAPGWLRSGMAALVAMALLETASLQAQNTQPLPKDKIVPRHSLVVKEPAPKEEKTTPPARMDDKPRVETPKPKEQKPKKRKHRRRVVMGVIGRPLF